MTKIAYRAALLAFASSAALLSAPMMAHAQDTTAAPPAETDPTIGELVLVGTRAAPRSRLETVSPVDVITAETLTKRGTGTELAAALASEAPSINFPRPAISDGSDHVRPATLRGLAPDQTLVLINGIRGHIGSLVNVNGSIGRGSTAFDLNTIPSIALGQVEILREGAAAQYGADAIAGVINLRLREADHGGAFNFNAGGYRTSFDTARGHHSALTDGEQAAFSGWYGFKLPNEGFLTLSGELQGRHPTNRADYVNVAAITAPFPVTPYTATTQFGQFGDPETTAASVYFNAAMPLNDSWKAYAFGGLQNRDATSAATARLSNNSNNVTAIYPNGFVPHIQTRDDDSNLYGGIKGSALGFNLDFSVGYGKNSVDYHTTETLNRSYGVNSATSFYDGGFSYDQTTFGIDASRGVNVGLTEPLNVAFGAQYREESYEIHAGEPASYNSGGQGGGLGAQGFGGFAPANAVDVGRHNYAGYIDLEGKVAEKLSFGLAGRYEDYSDFGDQTTGKLSARYDFTPEFALRGAISNGFKAPALQQQYFSYTATNLSTSGNPPVTTLIQSGKLRVNDPAAIALGAKPLEAETSNNYSLGLVYRHNRFQLTVDAYQIDMTNRIALSENLGVSTPSQSPATIAAVVAILAPFGVSAAQFFVNGVDTTTKGVDVIAHYRVPTDSYGRFDLTLAANFNHTEVTRVPTPGPNLVGATSVFLFDRGNRLSYEKGQPEQKFIATVDWFKDSWGITAKATSYDSVLIPNNDPASPANYNTGAAVLFDLETRYDIGNTTLTFGADNLFDVYPNATPAVVNSPTGSVGFPQYSPFGFNGRFLYGRVSFKFD